MDQQYLTISDVMQRLRLGKSSVYRRIEDGTLPKPIKIGSLTRFDKADVEAAIDSLKQRQHGGVL